MTKRTIVRIVIFTAATAMTCVTILIGLMAWMISSSCREDIVEQINSPSGSFCSVVVEKDCGATTSYSRNIMIEAKDKTNKPIQVAWADGLHGTKYYEGLNVKWETDDTLVISYFKAKNFFLQINELRFKDKTIKIIVRDGIENPAE